MTVVASTIARLQKSGLEAKVKSELALKENVNLQLDPSSPGQEVHNLVHSGVIRINKVLSPELCSKCLAFVTQNLDDAILRDAVMTVETGFGNVLCRDKRWDMYQPNDGPIAEALQYMLGSRENPLPRLFDELFESNDSYFHELSALISDLGALSQSIHPDTPYQPVAPLYTVFIALHEVTENMGGTVFLPGTNTEKHHEDHKMRSTKDDYTKGDDYRRSVLGTGDCVIFDSRTLHCGPANTEGRRTMLYFTLRNPLCVDGVAVPKGSLFPDISISIKSFRIEPPPAHDVCTGAT